MLWLSILLSIIQFILSLFSTREPTPEERVKLAKGLNAVYKYAAFCAAKGIAPAADEDMPKAMEDG